MQAKKYKISINFGSSSAKKSQRPKNCPQKLKHLIRTFLKSHALAFPLFFFFFN